MIKARVVELSNGTFVPQVFKGWGWKGVDARLAEAKLIKAPADQKSRCSKQSREEADEVLLRLVQQEEDNRRLVF